MIDLDPQTPYLHVECPTCGAQRFQHCMNLIRVGWLTIYAHKARRLAVQVSGVE